MTINTLRDLQSKLFIFIKKKYLFVLAVGMVLFFLVIIVLSNTLTSQNKETQVAQIVPTTTQEVPTENVEISPPFISEDALYYEETAKDSGTAFLAENSEIANHAQKEQLSNDTIKYTYESMNPNRSDILIVKNGGIILIRQAVVGTEISDGYKNLLGKQDQIIPGPTFYGSDTVIYFYSDGGTALIVNPQTQTTYEEFIFQPPISVNEFNSNYKKYTQ